MSKRILAIICVIETIIIILLLTNQPKTLMPSTPDVIIKEIVRDSIVRDSIFIVNERIKKEIVYIEKQAQQDSIDIMSANDSVLYSKFSEYINNYNNK
jgi:hypothetical protein